MKPLLFTMITLIPAGLSAQVSGQMPEQHPITISALPPSTRLLTNERELRAWIEGFKASPRGPFERIRWFCKD